MPQDTTKTYLTDAYSAEEVELEDPLPVTKLTKKDGKRPAVFLRYRCGCAAMWLRDMTEEYGKGVLQRGTAKGMANGYCKWVPGKGYGKGKRKRNMTDEGRKGMAVGYSDGAWQKDTGKRYGKGMRQKDMAKEI